MKAQAAQAQRIVLSTSESRDTDRAKQTGNKKFYFMPISLRGTCVLGERGCGRPELGL